MKSLLITILLAGLFFPAISQNFPSEMSLSADGKMLFTGGKNSDGLYDESLIRTIELNFSQPNYWTLLRQNYQSKTNLLANMLVDGIAYDSVGVRFKGMTSYRMLPASAEKRSFSISLDFVRPDQEVMGYETLNLNNCFQDPSFMREMLYLHLIRNHIPAAKASYVHLKINGQDWGLYPSIQQLNGDFLKEWFLSNDGTRWRADAPAGGGPGGPGGGWGDGTAALNYLGADTNLYKQYYTLYTTSKSNPWDDLVETCDALENTPLAQLDSVLRNYLDIDRTLWFLASEILFTDDDGYVYKGKMDYFLYWEAETNRMVPLEYDGNSCMALNRVNWSPFYHADDANYPLLNRLLAVPAIRQRYLAHMRTLADELLDETTTHQIIDNYAAFIDSMVQSDPKKLESYNAFLSEVQELKTFVTNRRNSILNNPEINQVPPQISNVTYAVDGQTWQAPNASEDPWVSAEVNSASGVANVWLHYIDGLVGNFEKVLMHDDGQNGDSIAGDGIFGAEIPAYPTGSRVRFYVEAEAADAAGTRAYMPVGAEHDVFIYQVMPEFVTNPPVVINELLASNETTAMDEAGEFDDWIELYNLSNETVDLSGWYLTDNEDFYKWEFPAGSSIAANGYLIVWADEDGSQGNFHANFKLSASEGETLRLLNPEGLLVDEISFGPQTTDVAFARIPNGTGPFVVKTPTFGQNNENTTAIDPSEESEDRVSFFPNPADHMLTIMYGGKQRKASFEIINSIGQTIWSGEIEGEIELNVSTWTAGLYFVRYKEGVRKLLIK
ncbi:MAG: CotH kinase family protein [Bacteroidia bacterium]